MNTEQIFTEIYLKNSWGNEETRSGPTATVDRTREFRELFPELLTSLGIESLLDIGCGEWNWQKHVQFNGVSYIGVDHVKAIVESNQRNHTSDTVVFETMNVLTDPPETADLWLARDVWCVMSYEQIAAFVEQFLKSQSAYLALTSVEREDANTDGVAGICRPLDLTKEPFAIGAPKKFLYDSEEWFRRRTLVVYTREQIMDWWQQNQGQFKPSKPEDPPQSSPDGTQDRNAHLKSNVLLKNYPVHGHMG